LVHVKIRYEIFANLAAFSLEHPLSAQISVALEPDADPHRVDAEMVDGVDIEAGDLDVELGGKVCGLFQGIANALETPARELTEAAAETVLNAVSSRDGETIISRAVEQQIESFEVPRFAAVDPTTHGALAVDASLDTIGESIEGVGVALNTNVRPATRDPDATRQTLWFFASALPPGFDSTTPLGASYDLAGSISTGVMNQALRSAMELGVFDFALPESEIDFTALGICMPDPSGAVPCLQRPADLVAALLARGVPPSELPRSPLELRLRPTLAPVVAMPDGPADAHWIHLHLSHYLFEIVEPGAVGGEVVWFQVAIDAKVPITFTNGTAPGTIVVGVGVESLGSVLVQQNLGHRFPPSSALSGLASALMGTYLAPGINTTLGSMRVPAIGGPPSFSLEIVPTEVVLDYNYVTLFGNVQVAP
jgi:hypothetical protein